MVYHGTSKTETIYISIEENLENHFCIDLIKAHDKPVFHVTSCCNTNWVWTFCMDGESNYEMVKHTIIDAIFECDDIFELMDYLDETFEDIFDDIVVREEEACDDCCCENCNHRNCLN